VFSESGLAGPDADALCDYVMMAQDQWTSDGVQAVTDGLELAALDRLLVTRLPV